MNGQTTIQQKSFNMKMMLIMKLRVGMCQMKEKQAVHIKVILTTKI